MTRYGLLAPDLRLPYTQNVFLIAMIHLDLPSIKAGLNQQLDGSPEVGCQKESWLTIVKVRVLGQLVRNRRDHDQPQPPGTRSPFPQNVFHFFVSQHTPLVPEVNPRAVPGAILLRAHSVGSEELLCIFAAPSFWGSKAQPRVLAAASQQIGAIQLGLEHRLVGEATIADHQEPAASSASRVQACAQVSNDLQRLKREILLLLQLLILLKLFLVCAFARLFKRRRFLKSHRNPARRIITFLIMSEQQRSLQKAQPIHEVHVKGRRQRIAMPRGACDLASRLSQFGIVNGGNHRTFGVALQVLIDYRVEQSLRLPAATREHLVIGAPVLVGSAQSTQRPRDGAAAKHARQSDGMLDGALLAAVSGKRRPPSAIKEGVKLLNQHDYSPPFKAKIFLSVRTKRSPRLTFLVRVETIDSRSSSRPWSLCTRSMISDTCSGLPARRSTSCTISICDVPLRAALGSRGPARKRRTALSWASSETSTACNTAASISSLSIDGILPLTAQAGCDLNGEDTITGVRLSMK